MNRFQYLLAAPKWLRRHWQPLPDPQGKPVIWIHAVSVGEVKAAQGLLDHLKEEYPHAFFLITTTTVTGQAEAKRSLPRADAWRYRPLDLPWIVKRWVRLLRPRLFLLMESDCWPNLLAALRRAECKTLLVSGKLSERSARRFGLFPFLARSLFGRLDQLLVQNQTQWDRFAPFVDPKRLHITGNLKFDAKPQIVDVRFWREKITVPAITIASTHATEEASILDAIQDLSLFLFIAPRHPERFTAVAALLEQRQIPFVRLSKPHLTTERVVLVDAMGQLPLCYTLSALAIVGGSFVPHIGGHNIWEPCLYGIPVLFGPHMFGQTELVQRVLAGGAGMQVALTELRTAVCETLRAPAMCTAAQNLVATHRGSLEKTLSQIRKIWQ